MEFILFINKLHFYISYIPSMCIFYFHTIIWRSVTSKSWFEGMSMGMILIFIQTEPFHNIIIKERGAPPSDTSCCTFKFH